MRTTSSPNREAAQPRLLSLAEDTGESASLVVLDGAEVVYVARTGRRSGGGRGGAGGGSALSVSALVRDASGAVVAALASSTSSGRSDVETLRREVVPLVVRTAARISADLGHRVVPGTGREGFF
ncbi:DNA-binding IclR family transcriptional regulator [Amycolatopsis lexingtonensis]|uniref:DNA-binding IclR family transcriptional regulator n=1 Tax=Amycolatopsis lexingtonensis TaxID=218822 RepID=A0ABR9HZW9_9PSEU|nr:hypothetical protein [Amycolatopsis lexingtonensis]MBE1496497.1 DNA-binding IclR family transcriptional regulator [Amycolatopsis lexingtonensis]